MPDILSEALALPGHWVLAAAAFAAGTVRGFSGFGTALIFLPMAALVVDPIWAILMLLGMDVLGPLPILRRTARDAVWSELALLVGCAVISVPFGVWLLIIIAPETYRYAISFIALGLVGCLVCGLRFSGAPSRGLVATTGVLGGVSGGIAGLPGPPVILLYMASKLPVTQVRANTFMFLFAFDFVLLGALIVAGEFDLSPLVIGLVLAVPNGLGNMIGQALFDPSKSDLYRSIAYGVVVASALIGLPLWDA